MRSTFFVCVLSASIGVAAQAQLGRPGLPETAQRLSEAVAGKHGEEAASVSQQAVRATLATAADQARSELAQPVDPEQAARDAAGQKRMAQALQDLSPEGKARLAQNDAPLLTVPATAPAEGRSATAAEGGAPKPKPLKPEPLTEPVPAETKQTIITGDLTYFDSANSIAVFVGNVVVDSPQFHITCDEFEVHMRKQAKDDTKPGPDGKPVPKTPAATGPKPDIKTMAVTAPVTAPGTGTGAAKVVLDANGKPVKGPFNAENPADTSIESAIGKGRKVVIVKHNPDGKIQIGQSRHAYYDGNTGDITLSQSPQVQDGDDLHIALEPTTVMIMTQAGALHTTGRATTKLMQQSQDGQPGAPGIKGGAPGTAPASTPARGGLSIPGPVPGQ